MNARFCIVTVALVVAATAYAQPMPPPRGGPEAGRGPAMEAGFRAGPNQGDMIASSFFLPELVMRHQNDIGLTADQETALRSEVVKFTANATDLRWQQAAETGALAGLLKQARPDEKAILAEQEKLLKIESDLKLSRLATLIRIKNTLTPEQQAKLTELQKRTEHPLWGRPGMRRGAMGFHRGFGHGTAFGWGGRMMQRGARGFHPGDGRGPAFRPGMRGQFPGRFPMQGRGMGFFGDQRPANPQ